MRVFVLFSLALMAATAGALSFSAYAFLLPPVSPPLTIRPCTAFLEPVALTGLAATDPGFEQGLILAQSAVRTQAYARQMAQWQDSPLFWGGANAALNGYLSVACHRVATEALSDAIAAVNANWPAVDRCVRELEHAGVHLDGPAKGLFLQWDAQRQSIENRTGGSGLGGCLVDSLAFIQSSSRSDAAVVSAVDALLGPQSVLQQQLSLCRDSIRVLKQMELDFSRLDDDVEQRLQEGQRLEDELAQARISLVPQYAFALQSPSSYVRTGWVQSFPEALQNASNARRDAAENRRKAREHWKDDQDGSIERAMTYAWRARDEAESAVLAWQEIDRQTQRLEADLLRQVDALRHQVASGDVAGSIAQALARQRALELAQRALPSTRGERILQLADAVTALKRVEQGADNSDAGQSGQEVKSMLDAAAADGLDVSYEKKQLDQWTSLDSSARASPEALDGIRESVLQKASERFKRLEGMWADLLPFADFVRLPLDAFDADGRLGFEAELGHLKELEKALDVARKEANDHKAAWLSDYLQRHLEFSQGGEPVVADTLANRTFRLSLRNDLDFGQDTPLLLKRPASLPASARLISDSGMRLLPDGVLLDRVPSGASFEGEGVVDAVLVATRSVKEETRYASASNARRAWTVTLDSQISGTAFWTRDVDYDVDRLVSSSGVVRVEPGRVKAAFPLQVGVNVIPMEFDVPNPIRIDKTATTDGWTYSVQSRVPFDLQLPWSFEESIPCAPQSPDFSIAPLSPGLYRLSANVTLHAFESKSFILQAPCVPESLANQTALLERMPGLSSDAARVLDEARQALAEGRTSEASWLLFQLQNPSVTVDPLASYRGLADDADIRRTLEKADAAWRRSDQKALDAAIKELDAYVADQAAALTERIKAVCSKCPPEVESTIHEAKAALFLSDLSGARQQLAAAQQRFQQWQASQLEQNRSRDELLARIRSASWPSLPHFESAWAVSEPAVRWRNRQPLYSESKAHADALQAVVKKLQSAASKAVDGKAVSLASVEADFAAAEREESALSALLDRLSSDAASASDASEKAFRQFGTPTLQPLMDAVREAQSQGRFAASMYASEQLVLQLQRAPAASVSPASGLLGSHSLLEVGAGVAGLLVLAALAYWFKLRKGEEPLEEIG